MVLNYPKWLNNFLSSFPGLDGSTFNEIYLYLHEKHKHDFIFSSEQIHKHKRKILPGDHIEKLQTETIEVLNNELKEILETLSYPLYYTRSDLEKIKLEANQLKLQKIKLELNSFK